MPRRFLGIIDGPHHPLGGPTSACDFGKAIWRVDGVVYVENNDQLAARRTTNAQLQQLQDMRDLIESQRAHNQRLREYIDDH